MSGHRWLFPWPSSLRLKAALICSISVIFVLGAQVIALSTVLVDAFGNLQLELTERRIERWVDRLDLIADGMIRDVTDNALWDETFDYVLGRNPGYLGKNYYYVDESAEEYDAVAVFNREGKFVDGISIVDKRLIHSLPEGFDVEAVGRSGFLHSDTSGAALWALPNGEVLILAAHAIHPTDGSGPGTGNLVYLRRLDPAMIAEIAEASDAEAAASVGRAMIDALAGKNGREFDIQSAKFGPVKAYFPDMKRRWSIRQPLRAELYVPGLSGAPIRFSLTLGTKIFEQALASHNIILVLVIAGGVLLGVITLWIMERLVLGKLATLDSAMQAVSREANPAARLPVTGNDEFGRLAASANAMIEALEKSHIQLDRERALLSGVLDSALEAVLACRVRKDEDGDVVDFEILRANTAATRMARDRGGGSRVVDQSLRAILPAFARRDAFERCVRVFEGGVPATFEAVDGDGDGRRWLAVSAVRWEDGVVLTFFDITERKVAEEKLRESFEEIERFNRAMLGRELRVVELKQEVNRLNAELGRPPVYRLNEAEFGQ